MGGEEALTYIKSDGKQTLKAVFVGGEEGTYTVSVSSKLHNIMVGCHMLNVLISLSECKTMAQLTIPTGLKPASAGYIAYGYTPCKTGDTFVDADTEIYMESGQLMTKLTFKSTAVYTSMLIKINMIFY